MLWKRMKDDLNKMVTFDLLKEDKLIDSGLIAICIIFIQDLIAVDKPDQYQLVSLNLFSVAIPLLSFHLLITQIVGQRKLLISSFLSTSFVNLFIVGFASTGFGILSMLKRVSTLAAL